MYCYIVVNTDLHKSDVIVPVAGIESFMYDDICNTINSSTRIGDVGVRRHNKISRFIPVESKILIFMFITH